MKIARYAVDGKTYLGEVVDGHVRDLLVDDVSRGELLARHLDRPGKPGTERALADVQLLAPVARPGKILCIGLNYLDHCRESGMEPPKAPVLFAKFANAVIGPDAPIRYDASASSEVDFEVELVAVIGKRASRVSEDEALDYVAGYTIGNDVSARDAQFGDGQWVRGKTFDTFCPLGPWMVTADEIPDPQALTIRLWVDGVSYQDSNTEQMIFPVRHLVSYLSRFITLEPGDLIMTGTPWGVGFARKPPVYLVDGNVVRLEIEGIGELSNPVQVSAG